MPPKAAIIEVRLQWSTNSNGITFYTLWSLDSNDQLAWVADTEQGPFDTGLEMAQWAWRAISKLVPPASC